MNKIYIWGYWKKYKTKTKPPIAMSCQNTWKHNFILYYTAEINEIRPKTELKNKYLYRRGATTEVDTFPLFFLKGKKKKK